jgi:hypothetical protein
VSDNLVLLKANSWQERDGNDVEGKTMMSQEQTMESKITVLPRNIQGKSVSAVLYPTERRARGFCTRAGTVKSVVQFIIKEIGAIEF